MRRGSRQKRRKSEVTAANEQIRELSLKPSKDAERIRELEKEVLFFHSSKNIFKIFAVNMNGFHFLKKAFSLRKYYVIFINDENPSTSPFANELFRPKVHVASALVVFLLDCNLFLLE